MLDLRRLYSIVTELPPVEAKAYVLGVLSGTIPPECPKPSEPEHVWRKRLDPEGVVDTSQEGLTEVQKASRRLPDSYLFPKDDGET